MHEFVPHKSNILVVPDIEKTTSNTGIILVSGLTENRKERPIIGTVQYVGSDFPTINPGDRVVFGQYVKAYITLPQGSYKILKEQDILGFVEK